MPVGLFYFAVSAFFRNTLALYKKLHIWAISLHILFRIYKFFIAYTIVVFPAYKSGFY